MISDLFSGVKCFFFFFWLLIAMDLYVESLFLLLFLRGKPAFKRLFLEAVAFIESHRQMGHKVYVHCKA